MGLHYSVMTLNLYCLISNNGLSCLSGVCAQSLYRLRAEQHPASPAAGWNMCCRLPVHAAIITSKQVMRPCL